jgi:adenine-specific DNA-methyltransferase
MEKNKLDMQSPDGVSLNIEKIAALFPNCVTETAEGKRIDFDQLKQELNSDIIEGVKERYRLDWPGKREAIVTANLPTTTTLRPVREDSVNFDTTENIYIEGDNLEVLKLLQESYLNKIKMIYIDPPYNTGKDFVYKDNFSMENGKWKMENEQDEEGNRMVVNPETSGRYHSDWLTMMYPRLKLARNLLTDDGVIFISIDDNEVHNLRKICDEIFGEGNFVIEIAWRKSDNQANIGNIARVKEYIICYTKKKEVLNLNKIPLTEKAKKEYSYKDEIGHFRRAILLHKTRGRHFYEVKTKSGKILDGPWMIKENDFWEKDKNNEILWTSSGDEQPYGKIYLHKSSGQIANDFWDTKFGSNQEASLSLEKLLEKRLFDFPKSTILLKTLLTIGSNPNDIILDFFSGSATTAHAVMQLNQEDGGNRKFIMVQLPEATDEKSEAYKAGYKNICEIGKERIRRAGKSLNHDSLDSPDDHDLKKDSNTPNLFSNNQGNQENTSNQGSDNGSDTGFRVYRLDSSNMKDVYYRPQDFQQDQMALFADNVKEDRTAEDLLTQVMLDWGLPLSLPMERKTIAGKAVFAVAGDSLYACFDKDVDETFAKEIAKEKPLRIVFKDSSFKDDTAKENVKQLLKQLSAETEMRVI